MKPSLFKKKTSRRILFDEEDQLATRFKKQTTHLKLDGIEGRQAGYSMGQGLLKGVQEASSLQNNALNRSKSLNSSHDGIVDYAQDQTINVPDGIIRKDQSEVGSLNEIKEGPKIEVHNESDEEVNTDLSLKLINKEPNRNMG